MSPGKIAAQVGHVCTICAVHLHDDTAFKTWFTGEQKKIVLEVHEKDIRKLIDKGFQFYILDKGYTEIPAGSLTALSLGIMTREDALPIVKRFQTLK